MRRSRVLIPPPCGRVGAKRRGGGSARQCANNSFAIAASTRPAFQPAPHKGEGMSKRWQSRQSHARERTLGSASRRFSAIARLSSSSILEFGHRRQSRRRDGKHSGYTETRPVQVTDARPFLIPPPLVPQVGRWPAIGRSGGGCLSKRNFLRTAVRYPHPGALRRPSPQAEGMRRLTVSRTASRYPKASAPRRSAGRDCTGRNSGCLPFRVTARSFPPA